MGSTVIEKEVMISGVDVTDEIPVPEGRAMYKGEPGASAYELAVANGFEGSEKDWLESLNGKDGYTPKKGVDYIDGKDGHTPQKGKDYFTEAERTEMVDAVKAQLITEQWTFTLMDGSVITKDVIME